MSAMGTCRPLARIHNPWGFASLEGWTRYVGCDVFKSKKNRYGLSQMSERPALRG